MRGSTAHNHKTRWIRRVREIYNHARVFGHSHTRIFSYLEKYVYQDPAWSKVPGWVRNAVSREAMGELKDLYRPRLHAVDIYSDDFDPDKVAFVRWFYEMPDGSLVTEWNPECIPGASGHRWNHKRNRRF